MAERPALKPVPETLHAFDVYRMPVRFEEDKTRSRNHYVACVVVDMEGDGGVAVKLTSNPRWSDAGDIQLLNWEQAGLSHVTTARCSQLVRFTREDLQGYTGTLSREDAIRLVQALREVPPSESVWL